MDRVNEPAQMDSSTSPLKSATIIETMSSNGLNPEESTFLNSSVCAKIFSANSSFDRATFCLCRLKLFHQLPSVDYPIY